MQDIMYVLPLPLRTPAYFDPVGGCVVRGCKIRLARCGGVTHWALTPEDDDVIMTVAWGQNAANGSSPFCAVSASAFTAGTDIFRTGELGLGPDEPKSATKPTKSIPLSGIEVFEYVFFYCPV